MLRDWLRRLTWVDLFLVALRIAVLLLVSTGAWGSLREARYSADHWTYFVGFGLTMGAIYALLALGFTMVYGILRLVNFAHGEVFMVGAFAAYFTAVPLSSSGLAAGMPLLAAAVMLACAMAVAAGVAVGVERIAYRPFRRAGGYAPLITAIGASFFLQYSARGMFGPRSRAFPEIAMLNGQVTIGAMSLPRVQVAVVLAAVLVMAGLWLIVVRTRMGKAMRAVSEDQHAAILMGIDPDRVVVFTFAVGGAIAGAAGLFYALTFKQVVFYMGFFLGVKGFAAAVLGGIGNIPGAMLGGFLLGLAESTGPALFLEGFGIDSPYQLRDVIAYAMLVMVLVFRPQGLLGERLAVKRA